MDMKNREFENPLFPLDVRRQLDALCDEYESALRSGNTVVVDAFLLRVPVEVRGELLRGLAAVHLALPTGSREAARVEDLLERFPDLAERPGDVVELLVVEAKVRRERGEPIQVDEYFRRFPAYRELLAARLDAEGFGGWLQTANPLRCPPCGDSTLIY